MSQFARTVVVIHSHPDDTEAFCAGTLGLLAKAGWKIVIATMTAGGMGGIGMDEAETIAQREKEARRAAEVLGAEYHCFGQRDGYLFDNEACRIAVAQLVRSSGAGVVMTHLPMDYHPDHRTTANIVEAATILTALPNVPCEAGPLPVTPLLYHTAPLGFSDPLGAPITPPHFYVDIRSTMETKMKMLAEHHSQIKLMRVMHKMDNFFELMKEYNVELGERVGVPYAEVYWQHLGGGFQKDPLLQETLGEFLVTAEKKGIQA